MQNPSATIPPRRGETFTFHGLDDDPIGGRSVQVTGISVSGNVQFTIAFLGDRERGLHAAPLTEVLAMIENGIWRKVTPLST